MAVLFFFFFSHFLFTTLTNFVVFCLQDTHTQMIFSVSLNAVKIYIWCPSWLGEASCPVLASVSRRAHMEIKSELARVCRGSYDGEHN